MIKKYKEKLSKTLIEELEVMISNPDFEEYQFIGDCKEILKTGLSIEQIKKYITNKSKQIRKIQFIDLEEKEQEDFTEDLLVNKIQTLIKSSKKILSNYQKNLSGDENNFAIDEYGYDATFERVIAEIIYDNIRKDLLLFENNKISTPKVFQEIITELFEIMYSWSVEDSIITKIKKAYELELFLYKTVDDMLENDTFDIPAKEIKRTNDFLIYLNKWENELYYILLIREIIIDLQERENNLLFSLAKPLSKERDSILSIYGIK